MEGLRPEHGDHENSGLGRLGKIPVKVESSQERGFLCVKTSTLHSTKSVLPKGAYFFLMLCIKHKTPGWAEGC